MVKLGRVLKKKLKYVEGEAKDFSNRQTCSSINEASISLLNAR